MRPEAPVPTVGQVVAVVDAQLGSGLLRCLEAGCGGRLAGWGFGVERDLVGLGGVAGRVRPRRALCAGCGVSRVLLPDSMLRRRQYGVEGIWAALLAAAPRSPPPRTACAATSNRAAAPATPRTPRTAPAAAGPARPPRPARPDRAPPRTPPGPAGPRTPPPGTAKAPTRAGHRQPPRPDLPLAPAPPGASDGPSGQAANLSRAGRSHSVLPTLTPGTTTPQAPPLMPAPPDA